MFVFSGNDPYGCMYPDDNCGEVIDKVFVDNQYIYWSSALTKVPLQIRMSIVGNLSAISKSMKRPFQATKREKTIVLPN